MPDDPVYLHIRWRAEFESLGLADLKSDPEAAGNGEICDMGRWLAGRDEAFKRSPVFEAIVKAHGDFHTQAGKMAERAIASHKHVHWYHVTEGKTYRAASERLIKLLVELEVGANGQFRPLPGPAMRAS